MVTTKQNLTGAAWDLWIIDNEIYDPLLAHTQQLPTNRQVRLTVSTLLPDGRDEEKDTTLTDFPLNWQDVKYGVNRLPESLCLAELEGVETDGRKKKLMGNGQVALYHDDKGYVWYQGVWDEEFPMGPDRKGAWVLRVPPGSQVNKHYRLEQEPFKTLLRQVSAEMAKQAAKK